MATQSPASVTFLPEFAADLLAEREIYPRARIIATRVAEFLPGAAVIVYVLEDGPPQTWSDRATVGADISVAESSIPRDADTLGMVWKRKEPFALSGPLRREDYAHLNVRRTVVSLGYYPLLLEQQLLGTIEIITFEQPLTEDSLTGLGSLAHYASLALATSIAFENERNSQFKTINRLTQLYDLERVFNSTLEMNRLLPIIASKIQEILEVQAVNLWMVHEDDLLLVNRSGEDDTVEVGAVQPPDAGIAAKVADSGKALLLRTASDPALVARNGDVTPVRIRSLIAVPIISQDSLVGVLEIINRLDGKPFDEDDAFFLSTISLTAASALHNASLLEAERKIEILETLVDVSKEITSTLNLERVLQVVVNGPQKIMGYERAAVALEQAGRLRVRAISGKPEVVQSDPAVRRLTGMLEWAATADAETYVVQHGDEIQADREETREKFKEYFAQTGSRAWYAIPLADDQGRLGVLSFESKDPDFLGEAQFEFIKVVAGQATVAVRNASLYTEVPFIGVLEPLLHRKRQFMRLEKGRRIVVATLAALVVLFLVFFPLPMRVVGEATVTPQATAQLQTEVDGVVRKVYVHEGDAVRRGDVIADLEDWDYRDALASAQAKHATAVAEMNRALASNDGSEAGVKRVQADYWASEVARAGERVDRMHIRSPIDGIIATPHIEDMAGHKLAAGDTLAQVLNTEHALVDVAIDEGDVALLSTGGADKIHAVVKLDSFPTHTFSGVVAVVSPITSVESDRRVFSARVDVPNNQALLRPGMQGRGKVWVGWRPAGYVIFRGLGMWGWSKLWSWFGW